MRARRDNGTRHHGQDDAARADLVIEILSPSSVWRDRHVKLPLYERVGVRELWIVDPERRAIEVLVLEDGRYVSAGHAGSGQQAASHVLAGFSVRVDDVLHIRLDRPEVHNAVDVAMRDGLVEAFDLAATDRSIAEVHLGGSGPSFCSGGDLTEFGTSPDPATGHAVRSLRSPARSLARVADRVRATVHGTCVGAGVELAAFAWSVAADRDATLRLPEVGMGLVPGAGGTVSLPRRIGRHRTGWLGLSGREIDAPTAQTWGLVDELLS